MTKEEILDHLCKNIEGVAGEFAITFRREAMMRLLIKDIDPSISKDEWLERLSNRWDEIR
jgi:hypothetical protein